MDIILQKQYYTRNNILPNYFCNDIIKNYEENHKLHELGRTMGELDNNRRKVTTLCIPKNNNKWRYIENILLFTVMRHFHEYLKNINAYELDEIFVLPEIIIQKYEPKVDFYKNHIDFMINHEMKIYRCATFIIYLNTVEEGGETVFTDIYKEIPVAGKLVFFPSNWTFPHKAEPPISGSKYILTGWICRYYGGEYGVDSKEDIGAGMSKSVVVPNFLPKT